MFRNRILKMSEEDEYNTEMIHRKLLSKALKQENQGMLVDIAWQKKLPAEEAPLNVLVMKDFVNIQIPISLQKIENLKVISEKLSAPLSAIDQSCNLLVDVSQRWEVNASQICSTTFKDINLPSLVFRYLRLPTDLTNVQAKLQKLVLYANGCFIHSSSDRIIDGNIGTVILQLPVEGGHQGGNLNVEYKGRTKIFENDSNSNKNFYLGFLQLLQTFYGICYQRIQFNPCL